MNVVWWINMLGGLGLMVFAGGAGMPLYSLLGAFYAIIGFLEATREERSKR